MPVLFNNGRVFLSILLLSLRKIQSFCSLQIGICILSIITDE